MCEESLVLFRPTGSLMRDQLGSVMATMIDLLAETESMINDWRVLGDYLGSMSVFKLEQLS